MEELDPCSTILTHTTEDHGHGRKETRIIEATTELPDEVYDDWAGIMAGLRITRIREIKGITSKEELYGITSVVPGETPMEKIAQALRGHWGIENQVHYVRDVTFHEDSIKTRKGNGAQVFAALRNTILNLFRLNNVTNVAQEKRRLQYHPEEYKTYLFRGT